MTYWSGYLVSLTHFFIDREPGNLAVPPHPTSPEPLLLR